MKLLKDIVQGAGYLEGYGHHPGTETMLFLIALCGLSGANGGIWGFIGGMIIGAIAIIPFWGVGCVSRARSYQRSVERTFNIMKDA